MREREAIFSDHVSDQRRREKEEKSTHKEKVRTGAGTQSKAAQRDFWAEFVGVCYSSPQSGGDIVR
jgi:hypothetical protein